MGTVPIAFRRTRALRTSVVDDDRGGVVHVLPREHRRSVRCTSARGLRLQPRIERGHEPVPPGILRAQRVEQMRREIGQVVRRGGQRLGQRQVEVERGQIAGRVQAAAAAKSRFACSRSRLRVRVHQRRVVRQHRERRGLRPGQRRRVAAEVAPRRGLQSHHVAAERRVRRVQRQDLVLVVRGLEPQRQQRLRRACRRAVLRSRRSPRDSRASCMVSVLPPLTTRPALHVQLHRARDRQPVDAGMLLEALVLEHEQRAPELLRHLAARAGSATAHRAAMRAPSSVPSRASSTYDSGASNSGSRQQRARTPRPRRAAPSTPPPAASHARRRLRCVAMRGRHALLAAAHHFHPLALPRVLRGVVHRLDAGAR